MTRPGLEKVLHIVADATQTHPGHPGHLKHLRLDPRRPRCHEKELLALPPAATRKKSHPCWQDSVFRRRKGEQNIIFLPAARLVNMWGWITIRRRRRGRLSKIFKKDFKKISKKIFKKLKKRQNFKKEIKKIKKKIQRNFQQKSKKFPKKYLKIF